MSKFAQIGKITQKLMQKCKTSTKVPLCHLECDAGRNEHLDRWQYIHQQQQQQKQQPNYNTNLTNCTSKWQQQNLNSSKERKRALRIEELGTAKHLKTEKYRRISPEFYELLQRYTPPTPRQYYRKNPGKLHVGQSTVNNYPRLTAYLQQVMQHNNITNTIYNIDFYNKKPDDEQVKADSKLLDFMKPCDIAYLLGILERNGTLTVDQLQHLINFLRGVATLLPSQINWFMKTLTQQGVLTPKTVHFLHSLLQQLDKQMNRKQLTALNNALMKRERKFNKFRTAESHMEFGDAYLNASRRSTLLSNITNLNYRTPRGSYSIFGSFVKYQSPKMGSKLSLSRGRIYGRVGGDGRHLDGFYEPWDTEWPWQDMALHKRYMHSNVRPPPGSLRSFAFTRGLEKYAAANQQQQLSKAKELLEEQASKKNAATQARQKATTKKRVTISSENGQQPTTASQIALFHLFRPRRRTRASLSLPTNKSVTYARRSTKKLPSFMLPRASTVHQTARTSRRKSRPWL